MPVSDPRTFKIATYVTALEHEAIKHLVVESEFANVGEFTRHLYANYAEEIGQKETAALLRLKSIRGNRTNIKHFETLLRRKYADKFENQDEQIPTKSAYQEFEGPNDQELVEIELEELQEADDTETIGLEQYSDDLRFDEYE